MEHFKSRTTGAARAVNEMVSPPNRLEHQTRRVQNFDDFELSLPDIKLKSTSSMATKILSNLGMLFAHTHNTSNFSTFHSTHKILTFLSKILTFFITGSLNPRPVPLTKTDTVWLFDNTAFRSPLTGKWQAEFVAAYWAQKTNVEIGKAVADIAEKLGIGRGDAAEQEIARRLGPFVWEIEPGREVTIDVGGPAANIDMVVGPGGRNAISSDVRKVPEALPGTVLESVAKVPQGADGILRMNTFYAEPEGWGIISVCSVLFCLVPLNSRYSSSVLIPHEI